MGKTVLVAVDGSAGSTKAVRWTADTLLGPGDRAVLVHVEPGVESEPGLFLYPEASVPPGIMAAIKRKRRERSQGLMQHLKATCHQHEVQTEIVEGDARTLLLDAACRHKASLLVVGSRNMGTFERVFLGSVSKYCVQNSPCPVLVYRDDK